MQAQKKKGLKKEEIFEADFVDKAYDWLKEGHDIRLGDWNAKEVEILNQYVPLTAKPVVSIIFFSKIKVKREYYFIARHYACQR